MPEVVTTGEEALSIAGARPRPRGASSAVSWVTWSAGSVDPVLGAAGELDAEVEAADAEAEHGDGHDDPAETAYQSQRRPTKSIERRPL